MLSIYPACFFKDETGYSVVFPDLNWLATNGSTETEAMNMAVECLAGYLYSLMNDGEQAPAASAMGDVPLDAIARELDADTNGAFVNMVSVDVAEYAKEHFEKSVRKTLTIPVWLNVAAKEKKINFSQTLQEALLAKIRA
ncbi:MAG: type II toxin-antitoxin system HicB family antitoxin [Lachnospiraceae bacterium]|nr:type II toxin-antitoxin system HicB family antitoxin [Lachnospiraceae bacterium]